MQRRSLWRVIRVLALVLLITLLLLRLATPRTTFSDGNGLVPESPSSQSHESTGQAGGFGGELEIAPEVPFLVGGKAEEGETTSRLHVLPPAVNPEYGL